MKRFLSLTTAAALALSLVPAAIFAAEIPPSDSTPPTVLCTCTVPCTDGAVDQTCPVCSAEGTDLHACQAPVPSAEPSTPAESTPAPTESNPTPTESTLVCTCTTKCAAGTVNADCPVCSIAGDSLSACNGMMSQPEPPQVITITAWTWVDAMDALGKEGTLNLNQPITSENLAGIQDLLPQAIQAEGETIAVTWIYDEQTQTFTAALPEGYVLADGVAPLTIVVTVVNATTLETGTVQYVDETGRSQEVSATVLTSADTSWTDGWYVISSDVTISSRITVTGDVKLILMDGYSLNAAEGISVTDDDGDYSNGSQNSLTIYGQAQGTGHLTATSYQSSRAAIGGGDSFPNCGTVIINGGVIDAYSRAFTAGIGGAGYGSGGTISIHAGVVNATANPSTGDPAGIGGGQFASAGKITITGGVVTANGSLKGIGGGAGVTTGEIRISDGIITANGVGTNDGTPLVPTQITGNTVLFCTDNGVNDSQKGTWNGIVFDGKHGNVYGDMTLPCNLTLKDDETLTIGSGTTLTVPKGVTLTTPDLSKVSGDGTLNFSGSLKTEPTIPEDISVPATVTYTGEDLTQTILSAAFIHETKEVTVMNQKITAQLITDGWDKTLKEETALNAGTYTVQFAKNGTSIETSVTVVQSESTLKNAVSTDKPQYTYGDPIKITAKPAATGVASFSLTPPADNQMAVYTQDGTQISEAVNPDSTGVYTITLDSIQLGAGTHTLTFKFTGNGNLAAASEDISVIINKATPSYSVPTGLTAIFGSPLANVALPSGWAWEHPETRVGSATVFSAIYTPADTENYNTVTISIPVTVQPADLATAKVTLGAPLTYTGKEQTQEIASVTLNGVELVKDTDYTISGMVTATAAGSYTLTLTGKGNCTGTLPVSWSIEEAPLTIVDVDIQDKVYDSSTTATVTGVSFSGLVNGEALALGTDYTAQADFADANAGIGKAVSGKVTLFSSAVGKNYVLRDAIFSAAADISSAPSKLDFKADRTKPVKGQFVTFSVTPQIKGDNRSFLQQLLGIDTPKVEFWVGSTKLGEVKVEEGKASTFAYDTDKGGLKLGKNTVTAKFTGSGNLIGCEESIVVYLHDSTSSAPTGDTSHIQTWIIVLVSSIIGLATVVTSTLIYRRKYK